MVERTRDFHRHVMQILKELPSKLIKNELVNLIEQKVSNAPAGLSEALADHVLNRSEEEFNFDNDDNRKFSIDFTEQDVTLLKAKVRSFVKLEVPGIVTNIISDSANLILKELVQDWPTQRAWQLDVGSGFRERLETRWGAAFDILRMMYTLSHEISAEAQRRQQRSRAKRNLTLRDTILRLHIRACQVTAEILCLMENGFADGAMARWRTIHEITIVAAVIARFGEDLAQRYRAHEAVEAKRAMDRHIVSCTKLGVAPPTKREIVDVERAYQDVLTVYGNNFGSEYGWASLHLKMKKPRFIDLEEAADKLEMRAHYNVASYNIHASPKGMLFKLGLMDGPGMYTGLIGASNIGFVDPAQNTAFDLTMVTALILRPRNLDDMVQLKILILLRDKIWKKLISAQRGIEKDHLLLMSGAA